MSALYMPIENRREVILNYARNYNIRCFVETGTADAGTTNAMVPYFDYLWTIEIDPALYEHACLIFENAHKVVCILGDSAVKLPEVVEALNQAGTPAIFWLDGHYCGGATRGEVDSPVISELETLLVKAPLGSVILIDDARLFGGGEAEGGDNGEGYTGYPHYDWIIRQALDNGYLTEIRDDIIRLTPEPNV